MRCEAWGLAQCPHAAVEILVFLNPNINRGSLHICREHLRHPEWATAAVDTEALALVERVTYKPGWKFIIDRAGPVATLVIEVETIDSFNLERTIMVVHRFPVPPSGLYSWKFWVRWLFEHIVEVERHEAGEFFRIDGDHPFMPSHPEPTI